jgi:type I restriction enzyme S subunit
VSFPRYPRYKDSGVEWLGEVPEHWEVVQAKRHIRSVSGGNSIKGQCSDEPQAGLFPGFSASGQDVWLSEFHYRIPGIVLSAVGARCGKTFKADGAWGSVANTHCLFPSEHADRDFLWYITNSEAWWEVGGTAQPFVKVSDTLARKWIFPPATEQRTIAAFLERETAKIDILIADQYRLIALLKEKRQAVISHAVTRGLDPDAPMKPSDVKWLGDVPEHWEIRSLSSATTKITNGYVGPTRDILVESGVRYLQSLHIKGNQIRFDTPYYVSPEWSEQHSKSVLEGGDVLIVQTGDIGQVAVVPEEFAGCNCHALIVVAPDRSILMGEWLSWCLNSAYGFHKLLSIQTGALHPHLNCGNVKFVRIPLPSLAEQAQIVEYISQAENEHSSLIAEAERAVALLHERRIALISAAVTGKIDVRNLTEAA